MKLLPIIPLLFFGFLANTHAVENPPNIVLIMTDDQGYGDFGFTGNTAIQTPNIDSMAENGVVFQNFYVCPVCSPTRACLMTGRYNYRTRVVDTYQGRSMMEPEEVTIAELLSENGYRTGIFGKWHLGDSYPMRPQDQGFHRSLVHRGGGIGQSSDPLDGQGQYQDPVLLSDGNLTRHEGFCTDIYFQNAIQFMRACIRDDQRFLVYIADNCPHTPLHQVPADWYEKYRNRDLTNAALPSNAPNEINVSGDSDFHARVFSMVSNIDENLGQLMRFLESSGVAENTLVIFLTDNGPNSLRYVAGLRDKKTSVYEGGIRTPMICYWPARIKTGATCLSRHAHIDVLPTLLDACGIAKPEKPKLDGRSFLPAIENPATAFPSRTLFFQTHRGNRPQRFHHFAAIRDPWKLVHASGFRKQRFDGPPQFELFNLSNDSSETNNVASANPEIVQQLVQEYESWFDDVSNTRTDNFEVPRIVIGDAHELVTVLTRQDMREFEDSDGAGKQKAWRLRSEADSRFDITLYFHQPTRATEATLQIGKRTLTSPLDENTRMAKFEAVRVRPGEIDLTGFYLRPDSERELVYQVQVETLERSQ